MEEEKKDRERKRKRENNTNNWKWAHSSNIPSIVRYHSSPAKNIRRDGEEERSFAPSIIVYISANDYWLIPVIHWTPYVVHINSFIVMTFPRHQFVAAAQQALILLYISPGVFMLRSSCVVTDALRWVHAFLLTDRIYVESTHSCGHEFHSITLSHSSSIFLFVGIHRNYIVMYFLFSTVSRSFDLADKVFQLRRSA